MNVQNVKPKKKLILMGLKRAGKSSIAKVVFHGLAPSETLFLESTSKVIKTDVLSIIDFDLWDTPSIEIGEPMDQAMFENCGAVVFIIDAQDDFIESLHYLYQSVINAFKLNPRISFEVFIHKVDGLSDDHKIDLQHEIHQRLGDEINEAGLDIHLSFHLTSIYDHSVFEAFSKVIQKLLVELPTLENLLNIVCSNSGIEKTFLFDVSSKIYIATDSSPVDMQSYELCSNMIDCILDMTSIYAGSSKVAAFVNDDSDSCSLMHLDNGMILYLRFLNEKLALLSLIRKEHFEKHGLISYNLRTVSNSILKVIS